MFERKTTLFGFLAILVTLFTLVIIIPKETALLFDYFIEWKELKGKTYGTEYNDLAPSISLTFRLVVAYFLLVCLVLLYFFLPSIRMELGDEGSLAKRFKRISSEFAAGVDANKEIVQQMYKAGVGTRLRYAQVRMTFNVKADGTCDVVREYIFEAGDEPIQVWKMYVAADQSAKRLYDTQSLKVLADDKVDFGSSVPHNGDHCGLKYLVFLNDPLKKELAFFFLPQIEPRTKRAVRIAYSWPKYAADLKIKGSTWFSFEFKTADPADSAALDLVFNFDKALGPVVVDGKNDFRTGEILSSEATSEGNLTWSLKSPASSMHERKIAIKFKLASKS